MKNPMLAHLVDRKPRKMAEHVVGAGKKARMAMQIKGKTWQRQRCRRNGPRRSSVRGRWGNFWKVGLQGR